MNLSYSYPLPRISLFVVVAVPILAAVVVIVVHTGHTTGPVVTADLVVVTTQLTINLVIAAMVAEPIITVVAIASLASVATVLTLISLISQVPSFACIRAFVLKIRLEEFFNRPTMREPLKIAVTFSCLEYFRKEDMMVE